MCLPGCDLRTIFCGVAGFFAARRIRVFDFCTLVCTVSDTDLPRVEAGAVLATGLVAGFDCVAVGAGFATGLIAGRTADVT